MAGDIAQRISELLGESELSQTELSRRLRRSRSALSEWKAGRSEPDLETFAKLCRELQVSADEVLGLSPPAREADDQLRKRLEKALARPEILAAIAQLLLSPERPSGSGSVTKADQERMVDRLADAQREHRRLAKKGR